MPFTTKRRRSSRRFAAPARRNAAPKRARRRKAARKNYWPNNTAGHRTAARKGWRKRRVKARTGGFPRRPHFAKDRSGARQTAFMRKKRRTRKNPARSHRRKTTRSAYRRNPVRSRRYARRRTRRNPINLRSFTNKSTLMTAATIGIGLVAGWMTLPLVSKIMPAAWRSEIESPTTWGKARGLINVAIGVALFTLLKNKHAKQIGMVVAGTGIYDLIAVNVPQLGLPSLPAQNSGLDNLMPAASGTYDSIGVHAASAMAGNPHASQAIAGSYGPANAVVPAYGPSAYGASYESSLMKSFGDDLDAFMS